MWVEFFSALALMLILEGIMPFTNPQGLRQVLEQLSRTDDRVLRIIGLGSMLLGLAILYWVR